MRPPFSLSTSLPSATATTLIGGPGSAHAAPTCCPWSTLRGGSHSGSVPGLLKIDSPSSVQAYMIVEFAIVFYKKQKSRQHEAPTLPNTTILPDSRHDPIQATPQSHGHLRTSLPGIGELFRRK